MDLDRTPAILEMEKKVPFFKSFYRSQIGSILATLTDLTSLFCFTEFLGIYYVVSAGLASGLGAIVGFIILRKWAFERTDRPLAMQAFKYGLVSLLILLLNMGGIYLITEYASLPYMYSKVIIAIIIGFLVSFPLFRYYVYR